MAIITISRGTMSGGEALAAMLSKKLGWPAVSREVIKEAAEHKGVTVEQLQEQLNKGPGFFKRNKSERRRYLIALQQALLERAVNGSFIYHGHAGHLLLKKVPHILKVRLIAPMDYRVQRLMETRGMNEDAAVRHIHQVDRERMQWTRFLYDVDWTDPSSYDLVCNLLSVSLETVADLICSAVASPEFRETPESLDDLHHCAVACEVMARLAENERTRGFDLDVECVEDGLRITGSILTSGMFRMGVNTTRQEILETAQSVEGVKSVEVAVGETTIPVE